MGTVLMTVLDKNLFRQGSENKKQFIFRYLQDKDYNLRGASLLELAIVIPLTLLFVYAVADFGNLFSQLPFIAQSGYNLAAALGSSPESVGPAAMNARFNQLNSLREAQFSGIGLDLNPPEPLQGPNFGGEFYGTIGGVPAAGLRIGGTLAPLMGIASVFSFGVNIAAPHLIPQTAGSGALSSFGNPAGEPYDCCGESCARSSHCGQPCDPSSGYTGNNCPQECYDPRTGIPYDWVKSCM